MKTRQFLPKMAIKVSIDKDAAVNEVAGDVHFYWCIMSANIDDSASQEHRLKTTELWLTIRGSLL